MFVYEGIKEGIIFASLLSFNKINNVCIVSGYARYD